MFITVFTAACYLFPTISQINPFRALSYFNILSSTIMSS